MEKKRRATEKQCIKETVNTEPVNIQETVNTVENININIEETENTEETANTEESDLHVTLNIEENELLLPRLIFIFTALIKFLIKTLRVYIKQTVRNFKGKLSAHDLLEKQYFIFIPYITIL